MNNSRLFRKSLSLTLESSTRLADDHTAIGRAISTDKGRHRISQHHHDDISPPDDRATPYLVMVQYVSKRISAKLT